MATGESFDLCRASLVFNSISKMEACLLAIGDDGDLDVVRAHESKMRLRESFNAAEESGGHRDIQLCVRLSSSEACARKVLEAPCGSATSLCANY
jgi:hypothetical protein